MDINAINRGGGRSLPSLRRYPARFWSFDYLIYWKASSTEVVLFDRNEFFDRAFQLIPTLPGHRPGNQDQVTFRFVILNGHAETTELERHAEIETAMDALLRNGDLSPARDLHYSADMVPRVLDDLCSVAVCHQRGSTELWIDSRKLDASEDFWLRFRSVSRRTLLAKWLRIEPKPIHEISVLRSQVTRISWNPPALSLHMASGRTIKCTGTALNWTPVDLPGDA